MAAATVIVDLLATKILPRRHTYYMEKYQEVDDNYEAINENKSLKDPSAAHNSQPDYKAI